MQPIVVNCMGPHSIPSAAGMCYLSWIGETSILAADQCLCFLLVSHGWFVDCTLFFSWGCINGLKLKCNIFTCSRCSANDGWLYCAHSHTAHFNFTCRLLCIHSTKFAFEGNILISFHSHCFVPCTVVTVYSVFRVITSLMAFLFIDW